MLFEMRVLFTALLIAIPTLGFAQDAPLQDRGQDTGNEGRAIIQIPPPETVPVPQTDETDPAIELAPPRDIEGDIEGDIVSEIEGEDIVPESLAPDYSKLTPLAEKKARLDDLFAKLAENEAEESANLVAEEIVALWSESGSASVNLLARRGTEAAAKGDAKLARRMFNHTVDLAPDYAEGWARSARLALTQKDYNRALNESLKTLEIEPRHFYTLWTLGNVFEALGRQDEALEAYREANRLYPELKAVKDRLGELENEVDGTVL